MIKIYKIDKNLTGKTFPPLIRLPLNADPLGELVLPKSKLRKLRMYCDVSHSA